MKINMNAGRTHTCIIQNVQLTAAACHLNVIGYQKVGPLAKGLGEKVAKTKTQ